MTTTTADCRPDPNTGASDPASCVCCLGSIFSPYLEGLERCTGCGHVRAALSWTPDMFAALYTGDYFKGGEYRDYEQEADALRVNFRRRLHDLVRRHPDGGRLWEIGCAYGFFLQEADAHFEAAGCDVAEEAVQNAITHRGVRAHCLDYLSYHPDQPYDVVCMWDTVEHLPEPHRFLEKAFQDLRPGGTLALSTGDIGACWARLRGKRWRLIHPPTHVHYFTRKSMSRLLDRLGYTQVSFHYHAFWRNLGTALEKVSAENPKVNMLYSGVRRTGLHRLNFPLNLFDLMTVYARKP